MRKVGNETSIEIDLPVIDKDEIDLQNTGDELHLRVRDVSRRIGLPRSVAGREIAGSRFARGVLYVRFCP